MRRRFYTLLYLLVMLTATATAQSAHVFKKYMAADGLSDNTVLCGLRDSMGIVWLGTNNGLNCFDGRQNTIYRNMVEDKLNFDSNLITALFEHHTDIWFGGSFGLYVFHRLTNSFEKFRLKTQYDVSISSSVQKIVQTPGGLIWIATLGQGLFIYDPSTGRLTQDSRHDSFFSDIVVAADLVFLASLQGRVVVYDQTGQYKRTYQIFNYISDKHRICLEYLRGRLYIGCDQGLYTLGASDAEITQLALPLPPSGQPLTSSLMA